MPLARWTPPRLTSARRPDQRTVEWLELFYDLVYVAALIQLGQSLVGDLTVRGVGRFVVLFTLLWWAWTGTTFLMNRVEVDDLVHRSLMIGQMLASAGVGVLPANPTCRDSASSGRDSFGAGTFEHDDDGQDDQRLDDGERAEPCIAFQEPNVCLTHDDKREICRKWPLLPSELDEFPECGYWFEKA